MIRIAITAAAFDAICATLPLGSVGYESEANERGERLIWLEDAMADRLGTMRRPDESYSDVVMRSRERSEAAKNLDTVSPSVTEATMRCDKCRREVSDDEPARRLWRSYKPVRRVQA